MDFETPILKNFDSEKCGKRWQNLTYELLKSGKSVKFQGKGYSMYPTIFDDDTIIIAPTTIADISLNDIILFKSHEGRLIVHRVINIENDSNKIIIVCKGDFAGKIDRLSNPEMILGKLIMIIRGKKVITNFSKSGILQRSINKILRFQRIYYDRLLYFICRLYRFRI